MDTGLCYLFSEFFSIVFFLTVKNMTEKLRHKNQRAHSTKLAHSNDSDHLTWIKILRVIKRKLFRQRKNSAVDDIYSICVCVQHVEAVH